MGFFCTLQTESSEHPDTKIVTLRGAPDNVAKAKESIKQLLEEALAPQEGETEEKIPCPAGIVGRIIGRGGETIRCGNRLWCLHEVDWLVSRLCSLGSPAHMRVQACKENASDFVCPAMPVANSELSMQLGFAVVAEGCIAWQCTAPPATSSMTNAAATGL